MGFWPGGIFEGEQRMTEVQEYTVLDELMEFGIPVIDAQHANLVRITNNLRMSCLKGAETANKRFIRAVQEAAEYVQYHFSTEEKLMALLEFPDFHAHKKEHADFIWEILDHCKQFQEGQNLVPEKFVYFFSEWIRSHICVSDKVFADFFISMKHHGKLRLTLCGVPQLSTTYA